MKLTRRTVLSGAIAAPMILKYNKSLAVPFHGSGTAPNNDLVSSTLAGLALSTWSGDLVPSGFHISDINTSGPLGGGNVFAYSGGCYMGGQKKWCLPGGGGHADSPNTGIAMLDMTTGKWTATEASAIYHTDGIADPGNPCVNTETSFKSWPNGAGQRAPMAGHRYAAPIWMPEIGYGFSYGQYSYNTATGNLGYGLFNSSGQHDQTKLFFGGLNGGTMSTVWLPGRNRLWCANGGTGTQTQEMNPQTAGNYANPCRFDINSIYPDLNLQGPLALIPDPNNGGDQAVVGWAYNFSAGGEKIFYCPKVGSGATSQVSSAISFGGAVPTALSVGNGSGVYHNSSWTDYAGNYKTGSTKILVWDWGASPSLTMTGLYLLDTSTWTFTGPFLASGLPMTTGSQSSGFRNFFVLTDYVSVGSYLPVGLVNWNNGELYICKLPWTSI